jgi:hypothetical protein
MTTLRATLPPSYSHRRRRLLRERILHEVPQLAGRLEAGESYVAATLLLDWASPRIPWATNRESLVSTYGKSASVLLGTHFEPGRNGVYCSGAADFFHKVLDMFEIENFVIEFGTTQGFLTHAATVVVSRGGDGRALFHLLDPTFSMHFSNRSSATPVTVDALLERERERRLDSVEAHLGSLSQRLMVDRSAHNATEPMRCGEIQEASTACSLETYLTVWAPVFGRNGFPTGLPGLLSLLGAGQLFRPRRLGVPSTFRQMQAEARALRSSIQTNVRQG